MSEEKTWTEEVETTGKGLVDKIKELIHEGNVRHIIVKDKTGKTLIEVPLVLGLAGTIFLPTWAAIGAIAALVTSCTLLVERTED
jgi:hypothetical protein